MASKPLRATADGALTTGSGVITGFMLRSGGANTSTAIVYDNAGAASGTVLIDTAALANNATGLAGIAIAFSKGCYLDITGTGTPALMIYVE